MFNPFDDYNWLAYISMVGIISAIAIAYTLIKRWSDK